MAELTEMSEHAELGPGVCAGMGTANTMHLACEELGMALPGTTPVRAYGDMVAVRDARFSIALYDATE